MWYFPELQTTELQTPELGHSYGGRCDCHISHPRPRAKANTLVLAVMCMSFVSKQPQLKAWRV